MNKLALGTAQFGMDYGINSIRGKVEPKQVQNILHYAKSVDINLLDTAPTYGNSEKVLGTMNAADFTVVTKTRHFNTPEITDDEILLLNQDFNHSLKDLKLDSVHALLVHNANDLLKAGSFKIIDNLKNLKKAKKIKKIGVSVYDHQQLTFILNNFDVDMVQLPFNIFDRRLINSGMLSLLGSKGIEVHARSIFLQGLTLMSDKSRPSKFNPWSNLWKIWHDWLNDYGISPLEASVRYAMSVTEISKVLVGIDTVNQLTEIVQASSGFLPTIPDELYTDDALLLNPSNWDSL
ncbi:MAG: aldo/keto reductase [Proteobacteria bacterium]|jgi:aryl-alcohol dehydrogenase-like predicted oxidoreductase|nr:aldo/keto reductase [Pseudomonadota bacterium]